MDFGFWVNFRQEDRKGEEKGETGDWKLETGEEVAGNL